MSGSKNNRPIFPDKDDYSRLIDYTTQFLNSEGVVPDVSGQLAPQLDAASIRYTYHLIYLNWKGSIDRHRFVDFLKAVFRNFEEQEIKTVYNKLSTRPKGYDYNLGE